MLLTLIILILLANALYTGARRGLVLQVIYTIGYFVAYIFARLFYKGLAPHLELLVPYPSANEGSNFAYFDNALGLNLDQSFYAGVAFLILLFAGVLIIRILGHFVNYLTFIPIIKQANALSGAVLSFVMAYVAIFLILYLLATVPTQGVQDLLTHSSMANFMIKHTPIFTHQMYSWWVTNII